jgi:hypothetical protein
MSSNKQLQKILLCLGMEAAALMGAPMRADEVEDLLRRAQQSKVESTIRQERSDPGDPTPADMEGAS